MVIMMILVINCGSSSLKFQLLESDTLRRLARGTVDRIGERAALEFTGEQGEPLRETAAVADHGAATQRVFDWLRSSALTGADGLGAVGHRVVHGGERFVEPTWIDDEVIRAIEALGDLAPLHNLPALSAIRAARAALAETVPMVAVFDTAFHRTLPPRAARYAIAPELADKHGIRRYGFHGLAHRFMTESYARLTSTPLERTRLVTLQLGNGCSATAIEGGRSVDTSMGFTPLEGLMMGTRSGDVDPSLAGFLARRERVDSAEVEDWLNRRSGLLGVSGSSRDVRDLLKLAGQGDERAALAVEMFCYRVRKCLAAYLAVLGGADAVVFGGGIGENAPAIRERICQAMAWSGLILDHDRNQATVGAEARISADGARIHAYVIPVDEAAVIAADTVRCLESRGKA